MLPSPLPAPLPAAAVVFGRGQTSPDQPRRGRIARRACGASFVLLLHLLLLLLVLVFLEFRWLRFRTHLSEQHSQHALVDILAAFAC